MSSSKTAIKQTVTHLASTHQIKHLTIIHLTTNMTRLPLNSTYLGGTKTEGIIDLPGKGDTGGVDPAGEAGGVVDEPLVYPGGLTIMILRVTLFSSTVVASSLCDLITPPPPDSLPGFGRRPKLGIFRSLPRPLSGRGPATVSSQS